MSLPRRPIAESLLSLERQRVMINLLRRSFDRPLRVLEVGVWQAAGSTQVWLEHLPAGSELVLLDAWRPYASAADLSPSGIAQSAWDYARMDKECDAAFYAAIERVRAHEARHGSEPQVSVQLVRAPADQAMAWMRDGSFDLVYIDGDHKYPQVLSDIRHAIRLVRPDGGVVCGDDLERLPDARLLSIARSHTDRDYLGAPHRFHPGVCLAVHECFGQVHMVDGFWWIHTRNGCFTLESPSFAEETSV